jgi:hypothetical protein
MLQELKEKATHVPSEDDRLQYMKNDANHIRLIRDEQGKPVEAEYKYYFVRPASKQKLDFVRVFGIWAVANRIPVTGDWTTGENVYKIEDVEEVEQIKWPLDPWLTKEPQVIVTMLNDGWPMHRYRKALRLKREPQQEELERRLIEAEPQMDSLLEKCEKLKNLIEERQQPATEKVQEFKSELVVGSLYAKA